MIRTFIQISALTVILLSSFFLIRGTMSLSLEDLSEISKPKWGYHTGVAKNLVRQRVDTRVGFILLLLSFFLQTGNMLWPMRICDFAVNRKGVFVAIVVSILLFFSANFMSNVLYRNWYSRVEKMLKKQE